LITVFTPTYNRATTIHRVYNSLVQQTYRKFEWLIIDDGSTDNIKDKVDDYIANCDFEIIFDSFSNNRGKHCATNRALELAQGEFFVVADSDDAFTPDALLYFMEGWQSIDISKRQYYCGIRACCNDQFGNRVSDLLPYEPLDESMQGAFFKYNFRRESWCMVLTSIHRNFLFPENHRDNFYPEGVIWSAMSRKKKLRFFNRATRIYYVDESGDSLINKKKSLLEKIPRNFALGTNMLNEDLVFFWKDPFFFIKGSILYGMYSIVNNSVLKWCRLIKSIGGRCLFLSLLPVAVLAYMYKKLEE